VDTGSCKPGAQNVRKMAFAIRDDMQSSFFIFYLCNAPTLEISVIFAMNNCTIR